MLLRHQLLQSRLARFWSVWASFVVAATVAGVAVPAVTRAVAAEPTDKKEGESWGPEAGNLRTRLVPLADHFTLGQPMKFRLELKNVGQTVVHYDPQQVDINGSVAVRDPQGRPLGYSATMFQTAGGKLPALTPGNVVFLFDGLDIDSQYLIVKPGKYTMQFCGYSAPKSNTVEIEVLPGTLPPIKRIAARLLDVLPKGWVIEVHGFASESDRGRAVYWDEPPPGWEPVRGMPTIELVESRAKAGGGEARSNIWLSKRKLQWTGKVAYPGQAAAVYCGKCPEGYIYAHPPARSAVAIAHWATFEKDFNKAMQIAEEKPVFWTREVKNDDDLKNLKRYPKQDSLILDNKEITDAGLKHLEGQTWLRALWLRRTRITDQGLESLKEMPQLRSVWLDGDKITDAGLEHLKGLTQLDGLSLEGTKITDVGLAKLKGLTQLDYLSVAETPITDAGLETIRGLTHLRSLDLNGTRITDAGLQHIKDMATIERLSLANTRITDAGLDNLKGLPQLTNLDLDGTRVTDEGVRRLQQGLPRCELFHKSAEEQRRRLQRLFPPGE
jgi:Leucine-rich repeat (LRR) protein